MPSFLIDPFLILSSHLRLGLQNDHGEKGMRTGSTIGMSIVRTCLVSRSPDRILLDLIFLTRVLRRIFGPKRDEVTGEWRRLHNEALYDLYSSPNITRMIKSRIVRRAGHVALMGDRRCAYRDLVET
jgi:hypothetical protein